MAVDTQAAPGAAAGAMPQPLAGLRVLELSQIMTGPVCGLLLPDMGADVTKVERFRVGEALEHPQTRVVGMALRLRGRRDPRLAGERRRAPGGARAPTALTCFADTGSRRPCRSKRSIAGREQVQACMAITSSAP